MKEKCTLIVTRVGLDCPKIGLASGWIRFIPRAPQRANFVALAASSRHVAAAITAKKN